MDLAEISDSDLGDLTAAFHLLEATGNKAAADIRMILGQHAAGEIVSAKCEIADYTTAEMAQAVVLLTHAIDASRERGLEDDYPALKFLLGVATIFITELESRGAIKPMQ